MSSDFSPSALAKEALELWEGNAPAWDDTMRDDGNDYWTILEKPVLQRFAEVKVGDAALDLATGNGLVARWLIENGASSVHATDGSQNMVHLASKRTSDWAITRGSEYAKEIKYDVLNLVDHDQIDEFVLKTSESKVGHVTLVR